MIWLWILGIVLLLFLLLCRTRVGIRVSFGETATLDVKIGLFRFRVLPVRKKSARAKKRYRKSSETEGKPKKERPAFPKPDPADIRDAVRTLWPPLKKALGRTWRGIHVDPLQVRVVAGGEKDPASTAELCGCLQAGVWTVMPQLERLMDIPNPYIHIGMDFTAPEMRISGEAGAAIRVGTILLVGVSTGVPALRWFLRYQKRKKQQALTGNPARAA